MMVAGCPCNVGGPNVSDGSESCSMKRAAPYAIVILLLCGLSLGVASPKKITHSVSMDNMKFDPADLTIAVGDTVEWTNNDDREHNVTAKDSSFKSPNLSS